MKYQVMGKATPSVQKNINTSLVYHYVFDHSPCYRAMIAKDLNLSAPAVSRAVEILIERGDIIESNRVQLENGKKVVLLELNNHKGYVVGIDLLRNPMKMIITDYCGEILKKWTGFSLDRQTDISSDLLEEVDNMLKSFKRDLISKKINGYTNESEIRGKIKAIGIGVPAAIDKMTGEVLSAQRYDYMLGKRYGEVLHQALNITAFVENVTNMSAFAERKLGVSRGIDNSVFIELSSGVGLGIFINGQLYSGASGTAGEIGYTPLTLEQIHRPVETLGYFEQVMSMEGISNQVKKARLADAHTTPTESIERLFTLAHGNNQIAVNICTQIVNNLVVLCSNVILMLNPEQVIVGGTIAEMPYVQDLLVSPLCQNLQQIIPFQLPQIILSSLGNNSGVIGAVSMAIEQLKIAHYPYRFEE